MKLGDDFATILTRDPGNIEHAILICICIFTAEWHAIVMSLIFRPSGTHCLAKLFQANTVNSLEEKIRELQKSKLQIEERCLDWT